MKKPFLLVNGNFDVLKIFFTVALTAAAASLFFLPREAVTVFSGEHENTVKSLFGLVSRLV